MAEAQARKPFHESIIDALAEASIADTRCLGWLIMATKIPKGHTQIIGAWNMHISRFGADYTDPGVEASLLEQQGETAIDEAVKESSKSLGFAVNDLMEFSRRERERA